MDSVHLAWLIRRHAIEMTNKSGGSHIGSIFSVADIIAVLYADILKYDTQQPLSSARDRFILSKGHAGVAVYAALAETGFFPTLELQHYYQNGSRLSGHVSHAVPGVEISTGSLGHGFSVALGMALAAKKDGARHKIYTILGDGECNEGSVWEAMLFAKRFQLDNLVAIVDYNKMQSLDSTEQTMALEPFRLKWSSFGWDTCEVDGHDHEQLKAAMQPQFAGRDEKAPRVIIAHTVKGKGVSFMENNLLWHYRFPHNGWEYEQAVCQLHLAKPDGVADPYTPTGIDNPEPVPEEAMEADKNLLSASWHPDYRK